MKIEITDATVTHKNITSKRGEQLSLPQQTAYLHNGAHYPTKFTITLGKGQAPFPPGNYALLPASFVVGRYGDLELGRTLHLAALAPASSKAA